MIIVNYKNWLQARQYSSKTIKIYVDRIERFLASVKDPVSVDQTIIQRYLIRLHEEGIEVKTLEGIFSTLKNFYTYLIITGRHVITLDQNPLKHLLPIKRQKRVPKIIPDDDLSALLRAPDLKTLRGCRDYTIMLFLLHGLRAQEICILTTDQVFSDGWGPGRKMIIDVKGKGRKERRIVIERSGDTEWAWNRYLQKRNGYNTSIAFPALLGKGNSKQLTTNGLYKILSRYAQRLGITRWHPHLWRHTAAVRMLEEGISIKEIQYRLGHESVQTTEKYLGAATILQEESANSNWIHNLKKADARFRRWRQ